MRQARARRRLARLKGRGRYAETERHVATARRNANEAVEKRSGKEGDAASGKEGDAARESAIEVNDFHTNERSEQKVKHLESEIAIHGGLDEAELVAEEVV